MSNGTNELLRFSHRTAGYEPSFHWRGINWIGDEESFCCDRAPVITSIDLETFRWEFPGVEPTERNAIDLLEDGYSSGHLDEALDEGFAEHAKDMADDAGYEAWISGGAR